MRVLGPLLDNLYELTLINPPGLEELYQDLLWIKGKVDDTAIGASQTKFKEDFTPDMSFVDKSEDFKALVIYRVTVAPA